MNENCRKKLNKYSDVLSQVLSIVCWCRKQKLKSPTIRELSMLIGNSEEFILESIEFGTPSNQPTFLH
ncbi:hypothetical protein [Bacillus solitudinis]|uniref:hypothetical protein n=1 Tax=Bacillus solitudinis TaxID=2014074 RepID=UPI000C236687|nr:hypothetical protein [Bacillus solitudinis]